MLRHIVLVKFVPSADDAQRRAVIDGLGALPGKIPTIRRYDIGTDLGLAEDNYDLSLIAEFDSEDDFRAYAADEHHVAVIRNHILPILAERVAVQHSF